MNGRGHRTRLRHWRSKSANPTSPNPIRPRLQGFRAFTLIELSAVIAITAILPAMLLTALAVAATKLWQTSDEVPEWLTKPAV